MQCRTAHPVRRIRTTVLIVAVVAPLTGCQSTGRLSEYNFAGTTLAAVYDFPPYPEILTGPYFPEHPRDPIHSILRIGSRIAKEVAAADVQQRLDSASVLVDVAGRLADRTAVRAARYLRAELIDEEASADFLLDVTVRDYGIDAKDWHAAAHVFIDAQGVLLDGVDGTQIWEFRVRERDPIMPQIFGPGRARLARDIVTAAALSEMTEEDIAQAMEYLADFAADRISDRLRDALDRVRGERRRTVAQSGS